MKFLEIHIEVEDVQKSLNLYKQLIPHKFIDQWADGNVAALVLEDGSAFGIWKKGHKGIHDGRGGNHVHFAFKIDSDDYSYYVSSIKNAGLAPLEHDWENGERSVYFFDYDGHQGEFMTKDWLNNQPD